MGAYRNDPVGYARDVLGVRPWSAQEEIARATLEPPCRVAVQSGHSVGKTYTGAWLTNWWYDTRDPSAVITTAPTAREVRDLLWKEVRLQRKARGGFAGASAPELRSAPDHYAKGFTASRGESFQGRHDAEMLFLLDEAVGVDAIFFETIKSMFKPELGHAWVMFFNPTDTTSRAYQEVRSGNWRVLRMSSLDHPNVAAQLAGLPPPVPSAVSLSQIEAAIAEDCEPVEDGDEHQEADFEFPPGSRKWYRPGPVFMARWLGLWPPSGTYGVWSEALWRLALAPPASEPQADWKAEIGCDVARYGSNWTAIHVRVGPASVLHERHNGWSTDRTTGRLLELCREWGPPHNHLAQKVPVKVDDDGVGGGVVDQGRAQGHNFIPVNAGRVPMRPDNYPNVRSELWFLTAALARRGLLSLARLPRDVRQRLERQALAPSWALDATGRRVVESKDDTAVKLNGESPDEMDAVNLCYYPAAGGGSIQAVEVPRRQTPARPTLEARARGRVSGHGFGR